MSTPTCIGLLGIGLSGLDAQIFRGINRFARPHRRWRIVSAFEQDATFAALLALQPAGILGHINDPKVARQLARRHLPVVNLSGIHPDAGCPLVRPDDQQVGELAAQHLVERGFRHLAYFAGAHYYERERELGFLGAARSAGLKARSFRQDVGAEGFESAGNAAFDEKRRAAWLRSLPRPVGILAAHDRLALQLLDLCLSLGLDVPGEVAILGVDDEELICESSWPTISSVRLQGERLGSEAARILDDILQGKPASPRSLLLAPIGVTTRQSSDAVAVADPLIAKALRYIRDHAAEGINVGDVLAKLPVNRRSCERLFRAAVGRTPLAEIVRVRLERAKQLLATTDLPMSQIARAAGFRDAGHLWEQFRYELKTSPRQYRHQYRTTQ